MDLFNCYLNVDPGKTTKLSYPSEFIDETPNIKLSITIPSRT
jgi:hypothetical protein